MRSKMLFFILMLFSATSIVAQDWYLDFDNAKSVAAEKDRMIILVFQGSDWCAPCIKLDREIWSSDEFKAYARDNFIMLKADFPRRKANALPPEQEEKNKKLAEKYNTKGYFPFVVVMDEDAKVIGETGYKDMSPEDYIQHLLSFKK